METDFDLLICCQGDRPLPVSKWWQIPVSHYNMSIEYQKKKILTNRKGALSKQILSLCVVSAVCRCTVLNYMSIVCCSWRCQGQVWADTVAQWRGDGGEDWGSNGNFWVCLRLTSSMSSTVSPVWWRKGCLLLCRTPLTTLYLWVFPCLWTYTSSCPYWISLFPSLGKDSQS